MRTKTPSDSLTVMTEIVLPNDTNNLNNLFGGQLLSWMDRCAAIAAHRHCRRQVVTASVNNVSFNHAVPQGSIVTLEASVSRAFTSSMEVFVDVYIEDQRSGSRITANEAIYTFVAVDQLGNPIEVPGIEPESETEKIRFEGALRRKQLALILGGKMKPEDAHELKKIFFPEEN
ncbi:acyl-CoA thioesterase [Phaeocystidibacter luteus]|uniref:Acyl-CoA thioesterase n=1 Tax=Phaeocystidibacter luteus TaxID=911197 RepID=A0A6N6RJK8_9FLAO|nr:acyl-CoA thioesterase [Phaeocystidibacter luteus]KAB2813923.1 acyl-CoA thioesterase [Phaeocystidibacter luteus]